MKTMSKHAWFRGRHFPPPSSHKQWDDTHILSCDTAPSCLPRSAQFPLKSNPLTSFDLTSSASLWPDLKRAGPAFAQSLLSLSPFAAGVREIHNHLTFSTY